MIAENVRFFVVVCMCFGEEQKMIGHITEASENNMV